MNIDSAEYILSVTQDKMHNPDRGAGIAYLAWLCGPIGPHRLITKDFNPDPEFAFDNGVILGDLGTAPKNLLQHFFVATRLATEQKGAVERWKRLVDAGVHPALAFIGVYEQGSGGFNNSHSAMPGAFTDEWVINWANGTPVNLDKVWTEPGGRSISTDAAFGTIPRIISYDPPTYYETTYWNSVADRYPELVSNRIANSPWGESIDLGSRPSSEEDLITILKAEQERLGLES